MPRITDGSTPLQAALWQDRKDLAEMLRQHGGHELTGLTSPRALNCDIIGYSGSASPGSDGFRQGQTSANGT